MRAVFLKVPSCHLEGLHMNLPSFRRFSGHRALLAFRPNPLLPFGRLRFRASRRVPPLTPAVPGLWSLFFVARVVLCIVAFVYFFPSVHGTWDFLVSDHHNRTAFFFL